MIEYYQGETRDPEKIRLEREELERRQREGLCYSLKYLDGQHFGYIVKASNTQLFSSEKARLQAEAKAAEEARKKAEAKAAAEAKRKREMEREAARLALQKVRLVHGSWLICYWYMCAINSALICS